MVSKGVKASAQRDPAVSQTGMSSTGVDKVRERRLCCRKVRLRYLSESRLTFRHLFRISSAQPCFDCDVVQVGY